MGSPSGSSTLVATVRFGQVRVSNGTTCTKVTKLNVGGSFILTLIVTTPSVTVSAASLTTTVAVHVPVPPASKVPPRKITAVDSAPNDATVPNSPKKPIVGSVASMPALAFSNATVMSSPSGSPTSVATVSSGIGILLTSTKATTSDKVPGVNVGARLTSPTIILSGWLITTSAVVTLSFTATLSSMLSNTIIAVHSPDTSSFTSPALSTTTPLRISSAPTLVLIDTSGAVANKRVSSAASRIVRPTLSRAPVPTRAA